MICFHCRMVHFSCQIYKKKFHRKSITHNRKFIALWSHNPPLKSSKRLELKTWNGNFPRPTRGWTGLSQLRPIVFSRAWNTQTTQTIHSYKTNLHKFRNAQHPLPFRGSVCQQQLLFLFCFLVTLKELKACAALKWKQKVRKFHFYINFHKFIA